MTTAKVVRIGFRFAVLLGLCVVGFYIGRPLYWKLSATLQEIREKDYTQEAVKQGRKSPLHTYGINLRISSFSVRLQRRLQLDLHVINDLLPQLYGERGFSELVAEAQRSVGWGPGGTIRFEQERALKKAQRKEQIEMAKPKLKSKDKKTDTLLVSEPIKDATATDEKSKDGSKVSKQASPGKTTLKSIRRLLLL